jgi:HAD superfamily hydrolase (TIGR01509 family)
MITTLLFDFSWVLVFPRPEAELELNHQLVEWVRAQSIPAYILSASPPARLSSLEPDLVPPFLSLFSTKTLGSKHDPQTFVTLAKQLEVKPAEILFTDDSATNVEAARAAGLTAIQYQSNPDFFRQADQLL